jgi:hypothetical protein
MAVTIPIISEFDGKGIKSAIEEFKQLEGAGAKAKFALTKAAVPATAAIGALAGVIGVSAKAAMEDAAAQDHLAGVMRRAGMATDEQIAKTEEFISAQSRLTATTDDELRPAMATLVNAVGEANYAQELLVKAQDIAVSTGTELATVTDAMAKAANGNMKALGNLDPYVRQMIKGGAEFDEVMQALEIHTGAASQAAETQAGKMKNLQIQFGEAQESIGAAFLPVLTALVEKLIPVATWMQENTDIVLILMGVVGGLAGAILAINAAMKVYQATLVVVKVAQAALNFVMAANPIGLVIVAIGALVAAFVVLEVKFGVISKALSFVGKAFVDYIINPIRTALDFIGKLIAALGKIPGLGAVAGAVGGVVGKIPGLAEGGIVTGPTLAVVGEAGPEAVVPLSKMGQMGNVTININSTVADDRLGDIIVNAIRQYNRRSGPAQIQVA